MNESLFEDHFIVCDVGHLGRRVVELLTQLSKKVVVVSKERDANLEAQVVGDVQVMTGDPRDERVLLQAGLLRARAVIALADDDLGNIEIALDTLRLAPQVAVVLRIFDAKLGTTLEQTLGLRRAVAMSNVAAPLFASAALVDTFFGSFELGNARWMVMSDDKEGPASRVPLIEGSPDRKRLALVSQAGSSLGADLRTTSTKRAIKRSRAHAYARVFASVWRGAPAAFKAALVVLLMLTVLGVVVFCYGLDLGPVDSIYFVITTLTTTGYGDITPRSAAAELKLFACLVMLVGSCGTALLYSLLTDFIIRERFKEILGGVEPPQEDHVIVVGVGHVGYRIVESLRAMGRAAIAIEQREDGPFLHEVRTHTHVILGDGRFKTTLERAGIARASVVIAATSNDAVNLEVALAARQLNPEIRTVARLFDPGFASKVEGALGVNCALSASRLAAPMFVAAALYPSVHTSFVLNQELVIIRSSLANEAPVTLLEGYPLVVTRLSL